MPLKPNAARVADILRKAGLLDELQRRSSLARLEQWGGRLTSALADMGIADGQAVAQALGAALDLPVIKLDGLPRDGGALSRLDASTCKEHGVFPVSLKDRRLTLAMADPTELDLVDRLAAQLQLRIAVVVTSEQQVAAAIARHYLGKSAPAGDNLARRAVVSDVPHSREPMYEPGARPGAAPSRSPSADSLLDELLDEGNQTVPVGLSPDELTRLDALRANQEKTSAALRALTALLAEKGYR
jgi:hypothetical protein